MRKHLSWLALAVCLLLLPAIPGEKAVAGDDARGELATLRRAYRSLGELAMTYAELAEFYSAEGRTEEALQAQLLLRHLLNEQKRVGGQVEALVWKAIGGKKPATAKKPGDDRISDRPFDGPDTGASIRVPEKVPAVVSGRAAKRGLRAEGGARVTQGAVDLGLEWLKNHQHPEGYWDADGFSAQCKLDKCDGPGYALFDPGVSGLAILAFLGAGETHKTGHYRDTVKRGLKYLKQIQDPEGCFGPRTTNRFTYNHAVATLAMVEGYALTGSPLFKQSAQAGVDFIEKCRNPYLAWRYGVRPQDNDTSVTGWMIAALRSAKSAGLRVPDQAFAGAKAWLDKVTEPEYGKVGYTARGTGPARPQDVMDRFPPDKSEALTAEGILIRIFCGEDPRKSEMIQKGTDLCLKVLPEWDEDAGTIDMYYWYYGTLAMFQVGGEPWKAWNAAIKPAIVDHQRKDGDAKGSWDPIGVWGREGGRVYSTALMTLSLEVYYRYARVFGVHADRGPPPVIEEVEVVEEVPAKKVDLSRKVSFAFTETPAAVVLRFIEKLSGTPLRIDPSANKVLMDTRISLSVRDMTLSGALNLIASLTDTAWGVDQGGIVVRKEK